MVPTRKLFLLFLVIFIIGGIIGYSIGFGVGVKVVIRNALEIMPRFTNFTIDTQAMQDALFQYKNRIGGCYLPKL